MKRYLITIEYLGKNYNGYQLQKDANIITVQGTIQTALQQVFKKHINIFASGRLDSKANAKALKAHFDVDSKIPFYKLKGAINNYLPDDISIIDLQQVDNNFHARYHTKEKTYVYTMYVSRHKHPFIHDVSLQLYTQPNLKLMKKASKYLVGTHDFSAFSSKGSSVKTSTRTVKSIKLKQKNNIITLTISGNGFLYNMVRIITGTLLQVGYKNIKPDYIKTILKSKKRSKAGKLVTAKALTLTNVKY
jgi:tRNA pseudouridine38-40 synthase